MLDALDAFADHPAVVPELSDHLLRQLQGFVLRDQRAKKKKQFLWKRQISSRRLFVCDWYDGSLVAVHCACELEPSKQKSASGREFGEAVARCNGQNHDLSSQEITV